MARHKKKKIHHRRRRVSGTAKGVTGLIIKAAGVVGGGVIAAYGVQAVNTAMGAGKMPMWAAPALFAAAGAAASAMSKNPLVEAAGCGALAVGGVMMVNEFGISVPGISGMAMSSNAGPGANVLRAGVGAGPMRGGYLNRTVAGMGQLISN